MCGKAAPVLNVWLSQWDLVKSVAVKSFPSVFVLHHCFAPLTLATSLLRVPALNSLQPRTWIHHLFPTKILIDVEYSVYAISIISIVDSSKNSVYLGISPERINLLKSELGHLLLEVSKRCPRSVMSDFPLRSSYDLVTLPSYLCNRRRFCIILISLKKTSAQGLRWSNLGRKVLGLGMQTCQRHDPPESLSPWLQLPPLTAMQWLCTRCGAEGAEGSPWGLSGTTFVTAYGQAWMITHRFLTRRQTPR